jgi:hypothetical protein
LTSNSTEGRLRPASISAIWINTKHLRRRRDGVGLLILTLIGCSSKLLKFSEKFSTFSCFSCSILHVAGPPLKYISLDLHPCVTVPEMFARKFLAMPLLAQSL